MSKPTFIYCLWCPIKRRIRYIGKTVNPDTRLYMHVYDAKVGKVDHYAARWIRKLLREGLKPRFRVLFRVPDGESWKDHECRTIKLCRETGRPVVNGTLGGEGTFLNPEIESRRRESLKASFTPESLRRRSESAKALWSDPEKRARIVAAQKAAAAKPVHRARLAKGVKRSTEGEARRIAAVKAYFQNPRNKAAAAERATNRRGPDGRMRSKSR